MKLTELYGLLTTPDELFGMVLDRRHALLSIRDTLQVKSLSIPGDSCLWDDSMWDYRIRGMWFHWTSGDLRKAERKARKHGFECNPDAPFDGGWRTSFPRLPFSQDYREVTSPKLP